MSGLTVREKEHRKERITRKIDQAIEALYSKHDPTLMQRIRDDARKRVIESLGLTKFMEAIEKAEAKIKSLQVEKNEAWRNMLAIVRGVSIDGVPEFSRDYEVQGAIKNRQAVHEQELLAENAIGRQVLTLQQEKEELLDTVWLATSSKQIRELWQHISEVLGQEPTNMQKKAITIDPMTSE